jgi:beta-glucanase (GH16 family)
MLLYRPKAELRLLKAFSWLICVLTVIFPLSSNAGWQLTFQDEFNSEFLDVGKWKPSDLWGNQTLGGNQEQQCYIPAAINQHSGMLRLVAKRQDTPAGQCKGAKSDLRYTSGMVTTAGCNRWEKRSDCVGLRSFSQSFGYFEVRAKVPEGKGFWSAFWLLPIDGTWPPEIDIMEVLGHEPAKAHQTFHFLDKAGKRGKASGMSSDADLSAEFHTFGIDWQPDKLIWYVDGKETYRFQSTEIPSKPMYLLINLAVGGYWPGSPDANTALPSMMEVDYVRVYQRISDGKPDDNPPR